jgi:wobble nucleotide-excising tRNase
MIQKFKSIKNLAVFQDFDWDKEVRDKDGNPLELKPINIIYGRNYSGKTTLSRILRSMETGHLSEKYENPEFLISVKDKPAISPTNLLNHGKKIRVFNEDFVRENLRFISNPEDSIESFAILGEDNNKIESEIAVLESNLGTNAAGQETGLYKEFRLSSSELQTAQEDYESASKGLEKKLSEKATNAQTGIKYQAQKFGDQNYNIIKLKNEIEIVLEANFQPINEKEKIALEKLILEKSLQTIASQNHMELQFEQFAKATKDLVERKVVESDKIAELVKDAVLNRWVQDGHQYHKGKREQCAFCGNDISADRWMALEKHFDEESRVLESDIEKQIGKIEAEKKTLAADFKVDRNQFYSKFQDRFDTIEKASKKLTTDYLASLDVFIRQLQKRRSDVINTKTFESTENCSSEIKIVWENLEKLRAEANQFTDSLTAEQNKAKESLRLREIADFATTIDYRGEQGKISGFKIRVEDASRKKEEKQQDIQAKIDLIQAKKRQLNDEEKGAIKVNQYLTDFFGHGFLSLRAIEAPIDVTQDKKIRFEIIRNGKKAFHLSEGECSLLAFCYFMARLGDIETKDSNPIIWIDDPISSLDSNHVFFIFSIIHEEIVEKKQFEQLFISTHNLDFLKYLKRLPGADKPKELAKNFRHLVIQRNGKSSTITLMPHFLREYVTEFNYLFLQIQKCSEISSVDDKNFGLFYNFGNNARKFLEIFLFYKYPGNTSQIRKLKKFFGNKAVPAILTDRINNEYSHLSSSLERGSLPIEVPEMNSAAKMILERIKALDEDQFDSLQKSVSDLSVAVS